MTRNPARAALSCHVAAQSSWHALQPHSMPMAPGLCVGHSRPASPRVRSGRRFFPGKSGYLSEVTLIAAVAKRALQRPRQLIPLSHEVAARHVDAFWRECWRPATPAAPTFHTTNHIGVLLRQHHLALV